MPKNYFFLFWHLLFWISPSNGSSIAPINFFSHFSTDVNDRKPIFDKREYLSSVPETAPVGTPIEDVHAEDADFGKNAKITYRISKGAYDDFGINPETGKISLNRELDYDRRDSYSIEIIAVGKCLLTKYFNFTKKELVLFSFTIF